MKWKPTARAWWRPVSCKTDMDGQVRELPCEGSTWKHRSGRVYTVLHVTNTQAADTNKFMVTVVYRGEDGNVWSRAASEWHNCMTRYERKE